MAEEELKNRILELEDELKNTKVNKKTEMSVGKLKAKIAKFKEDLEQRLSKGKGGGEGFSVKKEGDATIGFLGKPSVGKSTLLSILTNKESKIGAYEFTTLDVVPGLLYYNYTNLQILDLPGIIDKAADNRGFGKKILSVVRTCDLVVLVVDAKSPLEDLKMIMDETHNSKIRLNKCKSNITITPKMKGGVKILFNKSKENLPYKLLKEILNENKIINCEVSIDEKDLKIEDFIESLYKNLEYKHAIIALNKIDLFTEMEVEEKVKLIHSKYPNFEISKISADANINIEEFKEFLWRKLNFIYVYLKEYKKPTGFDKPLVVKLDSSIKDICIQIHKTFLDKFRFAKVKGDSTKFAWQQVPLKHKIKDKDEIEIFLK